MCRSCVGVQGFWVRAFLEGTRLGGFLVWALVEGLNLSYHNKETVLLIL